MVDQSNSSLNAPHKLTGHTKLVYCITPITLKIKKSLSLASASWDNTIKLWNPETSQCEATLTGHTSFIFALIQLTNGLLVSGSKDSTIRLWDISSIDKDSDNGNGNDTVIDIKPKSELKGHTRCVCTLLELNNDLLASGSYDKTIRIWNLTKLEPITIFSHHDDRVVSLIKLNDKEFLSASYDKRIMIWDTQTLSSNDQIKSNGKVNAVTLMTNKRIAYGVDSDIFIVDLVKKSEYSLKGHTNTVYYLLQLQSKENEDRLVSSSKDKSVRLWDVNKSECISILDEVKSSVYTIVQLSEDKIAFDDGIDIKVISINKVNLVKTQEV